MYASAGASFATSGPSRRLLSRRPRPCGLCPTSVAVDRRRAIWRSTWIKLRYRRRMVSVDRAWGLTDG